MQFDPPVTAESIAAAKAAQAAERAQIPPRAFYQPDMPTEEQFELLAAQDGLYALIQKYSAARVLRWVKTLAVIAGQEMTERPADRCLADGAALINGLCVRCGRDNS